MLQLSANLVARLQHFFHVMTRQDYEWLILYCTYQISEVPIDLVIHLSGFRFFFGWQIFEVVYAIIKKIQVLGLKYFKDGSANDQQ